MGLQHREGNDHNRWNEKSTNLKEIVSLVVHPHLVGRMMFLGVALRTRPRRGVQYLRGWTPRQLDRQRPLEYQEAARRTAATATATRTRAVLHREIKVGFFIPSLASSHALPSSG